MLLLSVRRLKIQINQPLQKKFWGGKKKQQKTAPILTLESFFSQVKSVYVLDD